MTQLNSSKDKQNFSAISVRIAGHNSVELFFGPRTACRLSFSGGAAIGPKIVFLFVTFSLTKQRKSKVMRAGYLVPFLNMIGITVRALPALHEILFALI